MTTASSRTVSALLPAWQAADFIQPTLDCLSAQTHDRLEVIVSVDACDDGTYERCAAHARRDRRFRVVRQQTRQGYVGNCNALLAESNADYVFFAFHDDIVLPDYVAALAGALDACPDAILAFSDMLLFSVDGRSRPVTLTALEGQDRLLSRTLAFLSASAWWVPNRGLFRREAARRIGGLKTHGAGDFSADQPWLYHMCLLGRFHRVPRILCHKHFKPGSLSRQWAFSSRQRFEAMSACMRELWNSDLRSEDKLMLAGPIANWLQDHLPSAPA